MKKLVAFILAAVSSVCLAFGLAACGGTGGGDDETTDWENGIYTVYTAYAEAQELGYSGTLDEFIASISGTNGVGISSVTINSDGELVVTLSDTSYFNLGSIKGADGEDGEDGSVWHTGEGTPTAETGKDGDMYLDTETYDIYQKVDGAWVSTGNIKGDDGVDGEDGKDGTGVTIASTEQNKDDDGNVISTTITFSDGSSVTVLNGTNGTDGKDGEDGADGEDGTGVTIESTVQNKDDDGNVISTTITFSDGSSVTILNGTNGTDGKDGEDGADGEDGTNGTDGKDGTSVTITSTVQNKDDSGNVISTTITFSDGSSITVLNGTDGKDGEDGADGEDGTNGEDGEDGSVWHTGEGAPAAETGKDGDMYLDTATYDIYQKVNGTWASIGNIKGTDGKDGEDGSSYTAPTETVTVTFDTNGGDESYESITVNKGDCIDLPTPTREGYAFVGWYYGTGVNAGQVTDVTAISRDMTLTAKWEKTESLTITNLYSNVDGCEYQSSDCKTIETTEYYYVYFNGEYSSTFSYSGYDLISVIIKSSDGTEYTITEANDAGIISGNYIYNYGGSWFEGNLRFTQAGEFTVYLTYEDAITSFIVTVNEYVFNDTVYYSSSNYQYGSTGYITSQSWYDGGEQTGYALTDYYACLQISFRAPYDASITINIYNENGNGYGCSFDQSWDTGWLYLNIYLDSLKTAGTYTITVEVDGGEYGSDNASYIYNVEEYTDDILAIKAPASTTAINDTLTLALLYTASNEAVVEYSVTCDGEATDNYYIEYSNTRNLEESTYVYCYFGFTAAGTYTVTVTFDDTSYSFDVEVNAIAFELEYLRTDEISEGNSTYFNVIFNGELTNYSGEYYPVVVTITDGADYSSETTVERGKYSYGDDNVYADGWCNSYNIYANLWFYVSGTYTVTISINESSYSFNVTVNEYEFSGTVGYNSAYHIYGVDGYDQGSEYISIGSTITGYTAADYYTGLDIEFRAPSSSDITVTVDDGNGSVYTCENYKTSYSSGWLYITLNLSEYKTAGTYTVTVTVDGGEHGSITVAYTLNVVENDSDFIVIYDPETSLTTEADGGYIVLLYTAGANAEYKVSVTCDGEATDSYEIVYTGYTSSEEYVLTESTIIGFSYCFTVEGTYTVTVTCGGSEYIFTVEVAAITFEVNYITEDSINATEGVSYYIHYDGELLDTEGNRYPMVITIADKNNYSTTIDVEIGCTYSQYDDNLHISGYYYDNYTYGDIEFYASGEYTVTFTINNSSYSFNVYVAAVDSFVYSATSDSTDCYCGIGTTGLTTTLTAYQDFDIDYIQVMFHSENYDSVKVTVNGSTLDNSNGYVYAKVTGYVTVYIYEWALTLGENTVVVSLTSTACGDAVANLTVNYKEASLDYSLSEDGTYYIVTGIGAYSNESEIIIPSTYNGLPVKEIGDNAFYDSFNLSSIVIPDSVTYIGNYAFYYCWSLTSVVIPDSVITIDDYAFYRCGSLVTVTLGNSVEYIGINAFRNTAISEITLPDSLTTIANYAFHTTKLTTLTIPANVSSIGVRIVTSDFCEFVVDENNKYFKTIDGNLYSYDGTVMYAYCIGKGETEFVIPEGVTTITDSLFMGASLTSVTLPGTLTTIEGGAFASSNISEIIIADGNTSFVWEDGVLYNADKTTLVWYCPSNDATSFTVPDTVTEILGYAFYRCTNLIYVTLPEGLSIIGDYAFYYCTSLMDINLPESLTSIGKSAFYSCWRLTSIVIPDGVTYIGARAFYNCEYLNYMVVPASATYLGEDAFAGNLSYFTIYYNGTEDQLLETEGYSLSGITNHSIYYYDESGTVLGYYWYYDEYGNIASGHRFISEVVCIDTQFSSVDYDSTEVETDLTWYANINTEAEYFDVSFHAENAKITVTKDGVALVEGTDYVIEVYSSYAYVDIYLANLIENCKLVVTAVSETTGTAVATINFIYNTETFDLAWLAYYDGEDGSTYANGDTLELVGDWDEMYVYYVMVTDFDFSVEITDSEGNSVYSLSGSSTEYDFNEDNDYWLYADDEELMIIGYDQPYNLAAFMFDPYEIVDSQSGTYTMTFTVTVGEKTIETTLYYVIG